MSGPSSRPSQGAAITWCPCVPAPGTLPWMSGIALPSTNCSAVCVSKNATIRGPLVEKRVDARRIVAIAQLVPEIGSRLLRVFLDAGAPGERIAGHPHPSARPRGGTAEHGVLFHQHDLQAVPCRGDGRGQPGRAGTDDEQVALQGRLRGHRHDYYDIPAARTRRVAAAAAASRQRDRPPLVRRSANAGRDSTSCSSNAPGGRSIAVRRALVRVVSRSWHRDGSADVRRAICRYGTSPVDALR